MNMFLFLFHANYHLRVSSIVVILYIYNIYTHIKPLRYKPEGRGFDSRWGNYDFSLA